MNGKKQKLERTWIGKENRPKLEPRILMEDPEKSYHARHKVMDQDIFDNLLIFGDNLLALEAEFTGKIKCIYIDPPPDRSFYGLLGGEPSSQIRGLKKQRPAPEPGPLLILQANGVAGEQMHPGTGWGCSD